MDIDIYPCTPPDAGRGTRVRTAAASCSCAALLLRLSVTTCACSSTAAARAGDAPWAAGVGWLCCVSLMGQLLVLSLITALILLVSAASPPPARTQQQVLSTDCITNTGEGLHTFICEGHRFTFSVPFDCAGSVNCGLIVDVSAPVPQRRAAQGGRL